MALGIPVSRFFELAGHDGSAHIETVLPEPYCRAGFHVQEAIDVCWKLGYSCTPIELYPIGYTTSPPDPNYFRKVQFPQGNWKRFAEHVEVGTGVIECATAGGHGHAVAFDSGLVFDPDTAPGLAWKLDELGPLRLLDVVRLWRIEA